MYLSEVYGRGGIYAKVVAASIVNGIPIYTFETKAPKFIDAEFEKHRMLSSNSSSSRAIPFKDLDEVYTPFDIRKAQKGMQGYESFNEEDTIDIREDLRQLYITNLDYLKCFGYLESRIHKQHLNRYLEPWMYQKKVVTATEWDNFFKLRLAPDAQPEIQELARCMKEAMELVEPTELKLREWHLPYGNSVEYNISVTDAIKCSVARCARVSYMNHDNTYPNADKDLALYEILLESKHLTPFEHQATPMKYVSTLQLNWYDDIYTNNNRDWEKGTTHEDRRGNFWSGNFRGFLQYRQLVSDWNG